MFKQEALEVGHTLKPVYNNVILVKDEESERRSSGGIILKNNDAPSHFVGKVVAVGSGRLNAQGEAVPCAVNVGDVVRYRDAVTDEFKYNDHDFVSLADTEIICILP